MSVPPDRAVLFLRCPSSSCSRSTHRGAGTRHRRWCAGPQAYTLQRTERAVNAQARALPVTFRFPERPQPLEHCMICPHRERDTAQVVLEVLCSCHNWQELPPCHTVASLTFGEKKAEVPYHTLPLQPFMWQYCTHADIASVCVQKERQGSGQVRNWVCKRACCRVFVAALYLLL